jgi:hypothetical protein
MTRMTTSDRSTIYVIQSRVEGARKLCRLSTTLLHTAYLGPGSRASLLLLLVLLLLLTARLRQDLGRLLIHHLEGTRSITQRSEKRLASSASDRRSCPWARLGKMGCTIKPIN